MLNSFNKLGYSVEWRIITAAEYGRYRLLTPIEAERLQDFPDDWTRYKKTSKGEIVEVSDHMRMFFMGNALVTNIVKRIGDELSKIM